MEERTLPLIENDFRKIPGYEDRPFVLSNEEFQKGIDDGTYVKIEDPMNREEMPFEEYYVFQNKDTNHFFILKSHPLILKFIPNQMDEWVHARRLESNPNYVKPIGQTLPPKKLPSRWSRFMEFEVFPKDYNIYKINKFPTHNPPSLQDISVRTLRQHPFAHLPIGNQSVIEQYSRLQGSISSISKKGGNTRRKPVRKARGSNKRKTKGTRSKK